MIVDLMTQEFIDGAAEAYYGLQEKFSADINFIKSTIENLAEKTENPDEAGEYFLWFINKVDFNEYLKRIDCDTPNVKTEADGKTIGTQLFWKDYYVAMICMFVLKAATHYAREKEPRVHIYTGDEPDHIDARIVVTSPKYMSRYLIVQLPKLKNFITYSTFSGNNDDFQITYRNWVGNGDLKEGYFSELINIVKNTWDWK